MRRNRQSALPHVRYYSLILQKTQAASLTFRLGLQWSDEICYRDPLKEISRLPSRSSVIPAPLPKKLCEDPARRDSGMSSSSSEMESSEPDPAKDTENDMSGWWEPRVKVNFADQLPGK